MVSSAQLRSDPPLLDVRDLSVSFTTPDGVLNAVRGASFTLHAGETLAVVGESGSGKSVCTQALVGLLPGAQITGEAYFDGVELLGLGEDELREIRGRRIGLVFQDPLSSLHPLYTVGWQLSEAITVHQKVSRAAARERAVALLAVVGIPRPEQRVDDYPHQFSGGMRQRVLIAMALALEPEILIADEPTTALDATIQAQILELLVKLQRELGTALIFITHDLGVVADLADRVLVMYAGRPVEMAERRDAYYQPHHPYTRGLLESVPIAGDRARLRTIPGQPPSMLALGVGCSFRSRCRYAHARCFEEEPPLRVVDVGEDHRSACWLPDDQWKGEGSEGAAPLQIVRAATALAPSTTAPQAVTNQSVADLLVVDDLVKHFPVRAKGLLRRSDGVVHAVDRVSLRVPVGGTLGLVGESGCGKSTLARCIAQLYPMTSGAINFAGRDISRPTKDELHDLRREVQIVFQDPYGSLNPRRRVGSIIGEALRVQRVKSRLERTRRIQEMMEVVGLNPEHFNRFPAEFSGGQRQRIGIARALIVRPKLLICDEPVSALDVSVRAQVINLLRDLQDEFALTTIFISHDLGVVEQVSDEVAVMYLGEIVEIGPANSLYELPRHPYTAALMSAAPIPDPDLARARQRIVVTGDVPSPITPPTGCRFHPRCPYAQDRCRIESPVLSPTPGTPEHRAACHYPLTIRTVA